VHEGADGVVDQQEAVDLLLHAAGSAGGCLVGLELIKRSLDGLITNGKFCCVRRLQLRLSWWHRPLRLRASALQTDVALVGEPDDPDVDRSPPAHSAPRWRAPVGSGLPVTGVLGRAGRSAGPGADRRGGA
jgi:hypothetical protein